MQGVEAKGAVRGEWKEPGSEFGSIKDSPVHIAACEPLRECSIHDGITR